MAQEQFKLVKLSALEQISDDLEGTVATYRDQARDAASGAGDVDAAFDTYAQAEAGLGSLSEGDKVLVWEDEDHDNTMTRYVVESGSLAFKIQVTAMRESDYGSAGLVILGAATLEDAQAALGVARRNYAINPHFDVWQAGASFNFDAGGGDASGWTGDGFIVDCDVSGGGSGACTITREEFTPGQTDVAGNPRYFLQFEQTDAPDNSANLEHRIGDVRELSDTTICVSYDLRVTSGSLTVTPRAQQVFGTGGSARVNVDANEGDWIVTTSWQRFFATFDMPSITGKTFGSAATGQGPSLDISLFAPDGATFTLQVAQLKIEQGSAPTPVLLEDASAVRSKCRELFERFSSEGQLGMTFIEGQMIAANGFRGTLNYYPKNPGYTPEVTFSALNTFDLNTAASTDAPSILQAATVLPDRARISGTLDAGGTAGQGASLRSNVDNDPVTATIDVAARF